MFQSLLSPANTWRLRAADGTGRFECLCPVSLHGPGRESLLYFLREQTEAGRQGACRGHVVRSGTAKFHTRSLGPTQLVPSV